MPQFDILQYQTAREQILQKILENIFEKLEYKQSLPQRVGQLILGMMYLC
jgi:hypothetical protein